MKKILALILGAVMASATLATFAGCGDGGKKPARALEELGYQYEDTSAPIIEEMGAQKYDIISQKNAQADDFNDMKVLNDLEESTHVDINWQNLSAGQYSEQKQLIMSDKKNWPDSIYHAYFSDAEMIRYSTRKTFLAVSDYLEYMPNLSAILEKRPDVKHMITMPDGKIWALPRVEEMGLSSHPNLLFMNKNWLNQLIDDGTVTFLKKEDVKDGLDLNVDQLAVILEGFKGDMNGNGKSDEIPLNFVYNNSFQGNQADLYSAFGFPANTDFKTVIDGKVTNTAVFDEYKEAINYYADWVEKGLIPETVFENSEDTFLASGKGVEKLGVFYWWEAETVVEHPENYIYLNPVIGPDGDQMVGLSNSPEISKCLAVVFADCPNPEILFTYYDRYYDPYVSAQIVYGPIGVVYEEELDENGMLVQKPIPEGMTADEFRLKNAPMGVSYLSWETWENYLNMEPRAKLRLSNLEKYVNPFVPENVEPFSNAVYTLEEINRLAIYEQNVYDYIAGMEIRWLRGGGVSDAEWETYKKELEDLNAGEVFEIYQSGYERAVGGTQAE